MNPLAKAELEDLAERGITPTPEEIVALNALAEEGTRLSSTAMDYAAPRRMVRCGALLLREPSLGAILFAREAAPLVDLEGYGDLLFHAFVISRESAELPSPYDRAGVARAVADFMRAVADVNPSALAAAVTWAWVGPAAYAGAKKTEDGKSAIERAVESLDESKRDWVVESALRGAAVVPGLSLKDALALTREQLDFAIRAAMRSSAAGWEFKKSVGPFYKFLDDLEAKYARKEEAK